MKIDHILNEGVDPATENLIRKYYEQIYEMGDDALDYLNDRAPLFAQFWDQYEGDLDSIIWELSPKNLQRIALELKRVAAELQAGEQGVAEAGVVDTVKKGAKKAWDYATEPIHQAHDIIVKDRAKNIAKIRKNKEQGVAEGEQDRKRNALWAQITSYEKRARETKNDIKKQHLLKMADELRGKLAPTTEEKLAESFDELQASVDALKGLE